MPFAVYLQYCLYSPLQTSAFFRKPPVKRSLPVRLRDRLRRDQVAPAPCCGPSWSTVPVVGGFWPLTIATAACAAAVASMRTSLNTVIVCQPEMMFCTPCVRRVLAAQRDRLQLVRLQRDDDRVRDAVVRRGDAVDLVAGLDQHLLEDRAGLLVVPAGDELLRALLQSAALVERVEDRVVPALEQERVRILLAAVRARRRPRRTSCPSGRWRRPCPGARRPCGRRTTRTARPMPPSTWRS